MKLRRTIKPAEIEAVEATPIDARRAAGKGRPTPKRREAEPRSRGPVAPPPTTRREAYKRGREKTAGKRGPVAESARSGERAMPARDRGPIRKLVRDVVDSRRSVASLFLPFAVLFLAGYFIKDSRVQSYLVLVWTLFFVLVIVDSFVLGRRVSKLVKQQFPQEPVTMRSLIFYGVQRSTMIRRWRFPKPSPEALARGVKS